MDSDKKLVFSQGIKGGVWSLAISFIGVLVIALVAKLCCMSDDMLPILNQALKIVAIAIGTLVAVRQDKFLPKGLICAGTFWLLSLLVFITLGGKFNLWQTLLDLVICVIVALIIAVIKSRRN